MNNGNHRQHHRGEATSRSQTSSRSGSFCGPKLWTWAPSPLLPASEGLPPTPNLHFSSASPVPVEREIRFTKFGVMSPVLGAKTGGSKHLMFSAFTAGSRLCLPQTPHSLIPPILGEFSAHEKIRGGSRKRIKST